MEDINNQVHQDKGRDIISAHHGAHFMLNKRHQLAIYSAGYKRSVYADFNNGFLHS